MTADSERPRLREYRHQLGWTQQEMADRLANLAWMQREKHVGVNADMIAKWERGVKGVSARYRDLLCRLFGVTPEQLGLESTPVSIATGGVAPGEDESLVAMLDNAAHLLDQLGAAGTALAPHMLHAWKDAATTTRRTMLGLLDPAATDPVGHARAATATTAELEQLAERYQALYETADPAALMTPMAAHLRMTAEALRRDPAPEERSRLLRNQAQVAILAGRLAADDLGNAMSGRAHYALALDTAREAGDDHLTTLAHGHAAELAAADGMTTAALDHLTQAAELARSCPAIASWLATIEATIHADRGEHAAARQALDRAHALSQPAGRPTRAPSHDSTTTNLAAVTGHVLLQAGDHSGARDTLTAALDQSRLIPRRQHVLALVDLATAELHSGNLPAACSHATHAANLLHQATYAVCAARLRAFRAVAQRPLNSGALRALDEHLSRIAA